MRPVMCRNRHEPPKSYGDCLRACIASIMDLHPEHVPHFADGGRDGAEVRRLAREWLSHPWRLTITAFALDDQPLQDVMDWMGANNPDTTWLLFGSTTRAPAANADHVVVCQGGAVVHDPAWVPTSIKRVGTCGYWEIWVVSRR